MKGGDFMDCMIKTSFDYELQYLYQYDKYQTIKIVLKPDNKMWIMSEIAEDIQIHFYTSNSKNATIVGGEFDRNTITVMIPNELLEEGLDIHFYVYMVNGESHEENTIASGVIPVKSRIDIGK